MNTDHYYEIGHKHKVCQDYATSGVLGELAFGVISDGCSASVDVDFGCRAMAFATKDALLNGMVFASAKELGQFIIQRASDASFGFKSLHPKALDATLLIALANDKTVRLLMYGDGAFVIRKPSGSQAVHVEFGTSAPFYLSYSLDADRSENYKNQLDVPKVVTTTSFDGGTKVTDVKQVPFENPVELTFKRNEVTMVSVISDGINSFREGDDSPIDYLSFVDEFTLYKAVNGNFQERRMMFFRKDCVAKMRTHYDDISIATIIVQPEFFPKS